MAEIIQPFPAADDDGTVMAAARNLASAADRFERRRAEIEAEHDAWMARLRAAEAAYWAGRSANEPDPRSHLIDGDAA